MELSIGQPTLQTTCNSDSILPGPLPCPSWSPACRRGSNRPRKATERIGAGPARGLTCTFPKVKGAYQLLAHGFLKGLSGLLEPGKNLLFGPWNAGVGFMRNRVNWFIHQSSGFTNADVACILMTGSGDLLLHENAQAA